jgi:hypothetical protein
VHFLTYTELFGVPGEISVYLETQIKFFWIVVSPSATADPEIFKEGG